METTLQVSATLVQKVLEHSPPSQLPISEQSDWTSFKMPTTRLQKQAMLNISATQYVLPSKLRTGSGRINKPGKPTRKHHFGHNPQQYARRQRQAPKLRVMFVRFLLDRLEAQGVVVENLSRTELREHIAAMQDNFLALAANLERDGRDVDDLADVFGQIVVPSGGDVVDMMDLLESTSLGGDTMLVDRDRDAEETSASSDSTADGDDSSESDCADTMLAADKTKCGADEDNDEYEDNEHETETENENEEDIGYDTDEGDLAETYPLPDDEQSEGEDYDHGIE